jgi:hypothetical protein
MWGLPTVRRGVSPHSQAPRVIQAGPNRPTRMPTRRKNLSVPLGLFSRPSTPPFLHRDSRFSAGIRPRPTPKKRCPHSSQCGIDAPPRARAAVAKDTIPSLPHLGFGCPPPPGAHLLLVSPPPGVTSSSWSCARAGGVASLPAQRGTLPADGWRFVARRLVGSSPGKSNGR